MRMIYFSNGIAGRFTLLVRTNDDDDDDKNYNDRQILPWEILLHYSDWHLNPMLMMKTTWINNHPYFISTMNQSIENLLPYSIALIEIKKRL
jgi:hypothetical protein